MGRSQPKRNVQKSCPKHQPHLPGSDNVTLDRLKMQDRETKSDQRRTYIQNCKMSDQNSTEENVGPENAVPEKHMTGKSRT